MLRNPNNIKVITLNLERGMNVCTKFHGNPSYSFTQNHKCQPHDWAEKSQGITKVIKIHHLEIMNIKIYGLPSSCCCDILVWTKVVDQPTDTSIPKATLPA